VSHTLKNNKIVILPIILKLYSEPLKCATLFWSLNSFVLDDILHFLWQWK